ncbi:uncharacterized protein PAC_17545 [Phialocephala subalpina]|uniref:Dihydrofolate reductase n=1 Tax=Phialocephala subalpina TaxID=576137 RepID=A0A1L7XRG6_9HELO|nr:uncharacterized protein PAC_17545 [Phialocephala subalpina]
MVPETITPLSDWNSSKTTRRWPSVTIIIAATQTMGMSFERHLPWPKLKREHNYFESTTKRVASNRTMNAVIMGYNTWDKEPTKRYPDRIGVVVTREPEKVRARLRDDHRKGFVHIATSIPGAVELLEKTYPYPNEQEKELWHGSLGPASGNGNQGAYEYGKNDLPCLGRIFIIGGAGFCRDALKISWVDRLLLTRVMADFKSDTFFPLLLDGRGNEQWRRQSDNAFLKWGGADIPIGVQWENGIEWEAYMFERV